MEIGKQINWSNRLEDHLKETAERSQGYSWLHKKAEALFTRRTVFIDLPCIIGSTIAGTLSIGSSGLFGDDEASAGMGIGLLSLSVGVLSTIGSYFSWSKRAEAHRISAIQYAKLFRFISIELALPREERIACADLLKIVRENYERLQEMSPLVPEEILDDFKKRFESYTVSKPTETNGLEEVDIYNKPPSLKIVKQIEDETHSHADSPKNQIVLSREVTARLEDKEDSAV